jgi:hypothetical protein
MKGKAHRGTAVHRVDVARVTQRHVGQPLTIDLDIGKYRGSFLGPGRARQGREGNLTASIYADLRRQQQPQSV